MAQVKTEIIIPKDYSPDEREAIADEILNYIIERTKKGQGKDGEKFPGYSKKYKDSLNFRIAGKSRSRVDLTLSGEMLDSLEVLKAPSGKVVLGYQKGSDMNGRAEGNILGSYGGEPDKSKARDFLATSKEEVAKILKRFPLDKKLSKRKENAQRLNKAKEISRDIVDNLEFEDG